MNSTEILELFFGMLPIEIVGLLLLKFSYSLKKREKQKFDNATKATVASVRVEEERSNDDYFKKNTYIIGLAFICQGSYIVEDFYSDYEYEVDTTIDIEVEEGKIKKILTPPPKGVVDNFNTSILKGHKIVFWIGTFICCFGMLAFSLNFIALLGEKYKILECAVMVIGLLSIYVLINKRMEKHKAKITLIKSGGYSAILGKIIDIKKEIRYSDGKTHEYYYPIIEYQEGYDVRKKVIYNNIGNENKLNENLLIYKDRTTGEILSEVDLGFLEFRVKILKFLSIFVLVIVIACIISYL